MSDQSESITYADLQQRLATVMARFRDVHAGGGLLSLDEACDLRNEREVIKSQIGTINRARENRGAEPLYAAVLPDALPVVEDDPCVVLDLEHSGYPNPAVIEVGIIGLRDGAVLYNRRFGLPENASWNTHAAQVHRITRGSLRDLPVFQDVADEVHRLLDGRTVVGHNIDADLTLLFKAAGWRDVPWKDSICTLKLSKQYHPEMTARGLDHLATAFRLDIPQQLHSATIDARLTRDVYLAIRADIDRLEQL